ncbi:MAG: GAF domain-containing protein [Aliifodinibius sp.]|nr:GAF domain-containing protein [Fodinibius sp.]
MALPLKVGNAIFGALDVQSTEEEAFSEEDVNVLQVLADSVAVAIQNTRLVQQLQESLETERRIYGDITREGWTSLLRRRSSTPAFHSNPSGTQATTSPITDIGKQAYRDGKTILLDKNSDMEVYPIAVPVRVRGDVTVAVIETQKTLSEGPWNKEEIAILESVAEDLGIALENARLVEETQRKAQRDRIAAELASKIWASSDMENILQTAVRELGNALHVSQGTIQLSVPDELPHEKNTDGANRS